MRILVGSVNPVKLAAVDRAVKELCERRPDLDLQFDTAEGVPAKSRVSEQPWELETWEGAFNRLEDSLRVPKSLGALFIGIESGLFHGYTNQILVDQCVVVAYFNRKVGWGVSSGFQLRRDMTDLITTVKLDGLRDGYTLDHAAKELGYTQEGRLGYSQGLIGLLSAGWVTREDQTYEAVRNALMSLFYQKPTPLEG